MKDHEHQMASQREDDADRFWNRAVERLERMDVRELAEAERRLAAGEDVPLSAGEVDAIVGEVVGTGRGGAGATAPRPRTWLRRLRPAAVIPLAAALAAAGVFVWLIWPEGQHSSQTMSFKQAIAILQRRDQPMEHRSSALKLVYGRVRFGIEALREVRSAPETPPALRVYAADALAELRDTLFDPSRRVLDPPPDDQRLVDAGRTIRSNTEVLEARLTSAAIVKSATALGIAAIRDVPSRLPDLSSQADALRDWLALELSR